MMTALARLPVMRLVRTRRAALPLLGWTAFALAWTLLARQRGAASADSALLGVYVPFVLPLVAYAVVSGALGGEGIVTATRPLSRFGASPRLAALTTGLVATLASAIACALLALILVVAAHNAADPPLAHDLALTTYATLLAGAAHGAFFVLGSTIGAHGGGRSAALIANWLIGASPAWISILVPYTHSRALLGGAPAVTLTEPASAWCLLAITCVSLAVSALRVRR